MMGINCLKPCFCVMLLHNTKNIFATVQRDYHRRKTCGIWNVKRVPSKCFSRKWLWLDKKLMGLAEPIRDLCGDIIPRAPGPSGQMGLKSKAVIIEAGVWSSRHAERRADKPAEWHSTKPIGNLLIQEPQFTHTPGQHAAVGKLPVRQKSRPHSHVPKPGMYRFV